MSQKFRKIGPYAVGAVVGVLISVGVTAVAQRERSPLPLEELRQFTDVFGAVKANYVEPVEDKKLITEAISGMLSGLDPHSSYLDADAFRELQVGTQGEFGGLGIEVGTEDGFVKVVSPIEDTPAAKAGIKSGDLIVKIDEKPTKGLTLNDAVKLMRGKPKTAVTLTVTRKGENRPLVFTLTRDVIKVQSVKSKMLEPGVAYVRVSQFQEQTVEMLARALEKLNKDAPLKSIVLDLRNDPGGPAQRRDRRVGRVPATARAGHLHRRPHRGRQAQVHRRARGLPARPGRGHALPRAGGGQEPCRWWCWSTAARPRPPRSWPARCRTTSAPRSSAPRPSARAACRRSCRCRPTRPSS
jgi:carboxyl-terminal processing protease